MAFVSRCAACLLFCFLACTAQADESDFNGPYAGLSAGRYQVFAGALIAGVDVLAQDARTGADIVAGWRRRSDAGWVIGLELQIGALEGDLRQRFLGVDVDYRPRQQRGYAVTFGKLMGGRHTSLMYAYVGEMDREFDVLIHEPGGVVRQRDGQGFVRFGLGWERAFGEHGWSWRASVGSVDADFGSPTQERFDRGVDLAVAVIRQF